MKKIEKINIVIPMAGIGSRFLKAGYSVPKPFINIEGKTMIERVLDNLLSFNFSQVKVYLIALKEHIETRKDDIRKIKANYNVEFVPISNFTDGAACTVLAAHKFINNDTPLIIANSDQIVDINITDYVCDCFNRGLDGSILIFQDSDPKWSFVRTDKNNLAIEVQEKVPISNNATVGIYLYSMGKYFIDGVMDMIARADKTRNEYYVCPVYNHIIKRGGKIGVYEMDMEKMHGIGTPEDLKQYLNLMSSKC